MKIDIYSHILPPQYLEAYSQKNPAVLNTTDARNRAVTDLETRLKVMDRYPGVMQVLSISQPALESMVPAEDAVVLSRLANDELGYIIPRRQWDARSPFAYGRDESQYGEVNSCGVSVAATLMESLSRRVAEARQD